MPVADALLWLDDATTANVTYQPLFDVWRADLLACIGQFESARTLLATTMEQLRERSMTTWAATTMQTVWHVETIAGDLEAAERSAREGIEQLEPLGERAWLSTLYCQLGETLYARGQLAESEESALRGIEAGGTADVLTLSIGLQVRAKVLAQRGESSASIAMAQRADQLTRSMQSPMQEGDAALALAEVLHLAGKGVESQAETRRAIECFERKGASACVDRARRIAATWEFAELQPELRS
jgi:ATP/maltotriose-dependent transcriptional regulator MalT